MKNYFVDINSDVGEGLNNENELMPYLSSCNIACGGHAGDVETMKNVINLAKLHGVKIGAHPSYPDRSNFGRKVLDIPHSELFNSLKNQITVLKSVLNDENLVLHHIKPHGALYNKAAKDNELAQVVIDVIRSLEMPVKLYAPYNSVIASLAQNAGIEVIYEAFADRRYNEDLSLVSRQNAKALITEKKEVLEHILQMITEKQVLTLSGMSKSINASTYCVHGDTLNAIEILRYLNEKLPPMGIEISKTNHEI